MIPCDSSKIWIKVLPVLLIAAGFARLGVHAQVPFSDQLTDQDLQKIISILGHAETRPEGSSPVPASLPSPPHMKSDRSAQASDSEKTGGRALPPSQDDIAQSLSLLSTLLSSNPQAAAAMGMNLQQFAAAGTTTTTTENPNGLDAQNAALLNALLASSSSASSADTSKVAALLGLASATPTKRQPSPAAPAPTPTAAQVKSNNQDAQSAAMLAQLLASVQGAQGVSPSGAVKQQDFGSFQNAPATLDAASSNQLSGILGLLGTLGSLSGGGGGTQPSLFNLGGQQQQQSNLLSSLLGGGQQQQSQNNLLSSLLGGGGQQQQPQQNNLLATLLASQSQGTQAKSPGILSSLGTIASVIGSTLGAGRQKEGKPTVRGVDTRLGLGYRFGENADAQVVWEIGPQLFTEPLTSEQKKQQLLQQQLQQQYAKTQQNPNRRLHVVSKKQPTRASAPTRLTPSPSASSLKIPSSTMMSRRLPPVPVNRMNPPPSKSLNAQPTYQPIPATTLRQLRQQLLQQQVRPTPVSNTQQIKRNYYDKQEANPLSNSNSQLTQYERALLQQQQQQQHANGNAQQSNAAIADYENRRDGFVFSKHNGNNVVRVNALPSRRLAAATPTVARMGSHYNGASAGGAPAFQRRSHYVNPAAEDSYAKRNAVGSSPFMSEYEREREREQSVLQNTRRFSSSDYSGYSDQSQGHRPGQNRRTVLDTISKWNEKNSMVDVVQNFVVSSLKAPGNNWVKNFFMSKENDQKLSPSSPSASSLPSSASSTAQSPTQSTPPSSLQQQVQQQQLQHQQVQQQQLQHQQQQLQHQQQKSPTPTVTAEGQTGTRGILPSITSFLFPDRSKNPVTRKPKPKPLVRVGDHVSYDELEMIIHGGKDNVKREREKVIPTLRDASEITADTDGFSTPSPEIFIDISNGEVSMRKVFGTMETFDPPPPEEIPEDSPKHVFNILREQLAKEYERVKLEQLREAAKQRRKENIANGLINPNDPIYMVSKDFDLIEKESS